MLKKIALSLALFTSSTGLAVEPQETKQHLESILNEGETDRAVTFLQEGPDALYMSQRVHDQLEEAYTPDREQGYLLFARNGIIDTIRKPEQSFEEKNLGYAQVQVLDIDEADARRIILEETNNGNTFVGDYHTHPDTENPKPSNFFGAAGDVRVNFFHNLQQGAQDDFIKLSAPQSDLAFIAGGPEFTIAPMVYIGDFNTSEGKKPRMNLTEEGEITLIKANREIVGPGYDSLPQIMGIDYVSAPLQIVSLQEAMDAVRSLNDLDTTQETYEDIVRARASYNLTQNLSSFASINDAIARLSSTDREAAEVQLERLMGSFTFEGPESDTSWKAYSLAGPAILLRNRPDLIDLFVETPHTLGYQEKVISSGREVSGVYRRDQERYEIKIDRVWFPQDVGEDVPTHEFLHALDNLEGGMDYQLPLCENQSVLNKVYASLWNHRATNDDTGGLPSYAYANSREFVAETAMLFHTRPDILEKVRFRAFDSGAIRFDPEGPEPLLTKFYQEYLNLPSSE